MFQKFKIFEHLNESDVIPLFTMSSTQASGAKRIESLVYNDSNLPPGALLQRRCRMFHERSQCPGHSHTLRGCRGCIPCDTSSRSSRRCCWTCAGSCWTLPRGISPCSDSCLSHTWRNDCFHILHHYHMCPPPLIWRNFKIILSLILSNLYKVIELSICVGSSHHSGPRVLPACYNCWIHTPELLHSRDHGCSLPPPDHTSSHHSWHNSVLHLDTSSPAPPPCHRPPWSWEQSPRAPDPRGMSAWQVYTWIRSDDTHCSSLWSWTHCDKTEHTGAVLRTNILCWEIDHV